MEKAPEEHHSHGLTEHQDCGQKRPQFKGVRKRKWGSWGSEIRTPKTRAKIWLGSNKTAEQAARAYDAAVYCLRGPNAEFNFPSSVPAIPSASSLSPKEIQLVAARYARDEIPSSSTSNSPSPQNNNNKTGDADECPSRSSLVSETAIVSKSRQQISEEWDMALWDCLFDGNSCIDLEKFPSIDVALGLDASQAWQEEEQDGYLWNLWDV